MEGLIVLSGRWFCIIIVSALAIGACLGLVCTALLVSSRHEPVDETGTHTTVRYSKGVTI